MKAKLTINYVVMAAAVAAIFPLASGCSSSHGGTGEDYGYSTVEYRSSTTQTTTAQAPESNVSGGTNTVIPLYKESLAVGKRDVDAGSVRVKKVVKTETVNQPVELRHEEIVIERVPASETASNPSGSAFQEGETVIHLTKEEPVVEKRTASAGQIVLQSRSASTQTNIQAQVRTEDVAVVRSGNSDNVTVGQNIQESGEAVGGAESPAGQATGESTSGTITNPAILTSGSVGLVGRSVQLSNLKVRSVTGDDVARLEDGNGRSLYIYCSKGAGGLKTGDIVNVKGVIRTGAGDLTGTTAQILSSQAAYIDAQKIEPVDNK